MAGETIRLLTRYQVGACSDPKENRLTAALVALLTESRDVRIGLAKSWSPPDAAAPQEVRVSMQRPVGANVGWIDFELDVWRAAGRSVFWVEAKLGSDLSGEDQLTKYAEQMQALYPQTERCLLLLVPGQRWHTFSEIPPLGRRKSSEECGPFLVSWQNVYGTIDETALDEEHAPGHIEWLRQEVLGYMKDQGLKASALTSEHVDALETIAEAQASVRSVLDDAEFAIEQGAWACVNRRDKGDNYWEYKLAPRGPADPMFRGSAVEFSWGVEPPDVFAGVYFSRSTAFGPIRPVEDEQWQLKLELETTDSDKSAWDVDNESDRNTIWVGRTRPLKMLIATSQSIEDQAHSIYDFVTSTFTALNARRAVAQNESAKAPREPSPNNTARG